MASLFVFLLARPNTLDGVVVPVTEPGTEPTTVPGTEPVTAPGTEPGTEPVTAPGTEPGTEPVTAPGTEPGTEPTTEPGTSLLLLTNLDELAGPEHLLLSGDENNTEGTDRLALSGGEA